MNPRTETRACEKCNGTGDAQVGPLGCPCTAPGCTLGQVPVVMPRLPIRLVPSEPPRAELDRMRAAVEEWGDRAARAEERALAAEQERDQWRERCGGEEALHAATIQQRNRLRDTAERLEARERANQTVGPCQRCKGPGWPVVIPEKARAVLPEVVCVACLFESHEVMRAERDAALRHLSPPVDDDTSGARLVKENG